MVPYNTIPFCWLEKAVPLDQWAALIKRPESDLNQIKSQTRPDPASPIKERSGQAQGREGWTKVPRSKKKCYTSPYIPLLFLHLVLPGVDTDEFVAIVSNGSQQVCS